YYAVHVGHIPGIYTSWKECEEQVKHFNGALYKKFDTKQQAEDFITIPTQEILENSLNIWTD
ncbi:8697_t:CDS:1, partial [Cetraspora pellucida]